MNGKSNTNWIPKDDNDDDDVTDSNYSSFSSSSSSLNGPLYELSELMNNLPIKRGLSIFYQGKAQSFGSLARVESIEDLAKKAKPNYKNKMKSCKDFGLCNPKATIAKKSSKRSCLSVISSRRSSFLGES